MNPIRRHIDLTEAYIAEHWQRWWANLVTGNIISITTSSHDEYFFDHLDKFLDHNTIEMLTGGDDPWHHVDPLLIAAYEEGWVAILYDGNNGSIGFRSSEHFHPTPAQSARILSQIARGVAIERIDIDVYADGRIKPVDISGHRAIQRFLRSGKILSEDAQYVNEVIRYRDRVEGTIIAVNPSQPEFKSNFKKTAGGVLTQKGDFVVGIAEYSLTHPDILHLVGIPLSEDRYHLGVWPSYIVVELWDNLDNAPDDVPLDANGMVTRKVFEKYTRFPKSYRDEAGQAVRNSRNIQRAYGGAFKVFVDIYAPELSGHPMNGRIIRDRY